MEEIKVETAEELRKARAKEFSEAPPSRVIEMALEDLEAVERHSDSYVVNMEIWHEPRHFWSDDVQDYKRKCVVCFAGSVMANSLGENPELDRAPSASDHGISAAKRLLALNDFRNNNLGDALYKFGVDIDTINLPKENVRFSTYGTEPEQFKRYMRDLVQRLRDAGL